MPYILAGKGGTFERRIGYSSCGLPKNLIELLEKQFQLSVKCLGALKNREYRETMVEYHTLTPPPKI